MSATTRRVLFSVFFLSGACGLIYQIVWTRMAFAVFGIITPVLSVVVSIFMLGLALGAWLGGRFVGRLRSMTGWSPMLFYAATELLIGLGAFAVPRFFAIGQQLLWSAGEMNSARYLISSALVLALSILPPCLCMGATFPFVMAFVREEEQSAHTSFSFLYTANVLGAMCGTLLAALVLIELSGFKGTLATAAVVNFFIAAISVGVRVSRRRSVAAARVNVPVTEDIASAPSASRRRLIKLVLFATGFTAMAMEVVWVRAFTPVIHTQVYSFAMILFAYLAATFAGSTWYRLALRRGRVWSLGQVLAVCAVVTFLPIVLNDMRLLWSNRFTASVGISSLIVLLSICPLCAALGYLTPGLIDEDGRGQPAEASRAYAINVLGCIIGPLFASYILLPWCGEHYGLILLALPFLAFYLWQAPSIRPWLRLATGVAAFALLAWSLFGRKDFAGYIVSRTPRMEVRRDYAASVIAAGDRRENKFLIVNGVGMTGLVPPTKFMIHLPLLLHQGQAESALIICFGMGTTFRSSLSWNIDTTAVELVPSVTKSFEFYHADAAAVRRNPKAHIVIDDGRRFLNRTEQKFDVIVIDPPPPLEAAGSSLLYSEEFYDVAKRHLKPNGILQTWMPGFDVPGWQAIARSLQERFTYVKSFIGIGQGGTHFLASMEPISDSSPQQLAFTMPAAAADDLLEWSGGADLVSYLSEVLDRRIVVDQTLNPDLRVRITDDRPFNEYFLLREAGLLTDDKR